MRYAAAILSLLLLLSLTACRAPRDHLPESAASSGTSAEPEEAEEADSGVGCEEEEGGDVCSGAAGVAAGVGTGTFSVFCSTGVSGNSRGGCVIHWSSPVWGALEAFCSSSSIMLRMAAKLQPAAVRMHTVMTR